MGPVAIVIGFVAVFWIIGIVMLIVQAVNKPKKDRKDGFFRADEEKGKVEKREAEPDLNVSRSSKNPRAASADPFVDFGKDAAISRSQSSSKAPAAAEYAFAADSPVHYNCDHAKEAAPVAPPAGPVSATHANCNHAKKETPSISLEDTRNMDWDEFKGFILALLAKDYPSAALSPYKYRGSPDIRLKTHGRETDVRLIHIRKGQAVEKADFEAALRDTDEHDDVSDWILTNGKFTFQQKQRAAACNIRLIEGTEVYALMRRHGLSAKNFTRKLN